MRVALCVQPQPLLYEPPAVPDMRVSTITPASMDVLKHADAWEAVAPPHSVAFNNMQVGLNLKHSL